MRNTMLFIFVLFAAISVHEGFLSAAEEIHFDFEEGAEGWDIPDWSFEMKDYRTISVGTSTEVASSGKNSLEVMCDFPGDTWTAIVVEYQKEEGFMDFSELNEISVDVYIPEDATKKIGGFLQARMILTTGYGWYFTEMRTPILLSRGKWVTLTVPIEHEAIVASAWRGRKEESRLCNNTDKIKKMAVRVEYNVAPPNVVGPKYEGPIYIDNVVIK